MQSRNIKWFKGLESVMSYGNYKGCRVGFLIDNHPEYIKKLVESKLLFLDKEAKIKLNDKLDEIVWNKYLTS